MQRHLSVWQATLSSPLSVFLLSRACVRFRCRVGAWVCAWVWCVGAPPPVTPWVAPVLGLAPSLRPSRLGGGKALTRDRAPGRRPSRSAVGGNGDRWKRAPWVCGCVCVCVCVRVCVGAWACVRACVCVCVRLRCLLTSLDFTYVFIALTRAHCLFMKTQCPVGFLAGLCSGRPWAMNNCDLFLSVWSTHAA